MIDAVASSTCTCLKGHMKKNDGSIAKNIYEGVIDQVNFEAILGRHGKVKGE